MKKNSKQTKDKLWIFFSNENNSKKKSLYHGCWKYAREKKLVNSLLSVNYHYYYYTVYFYFWQKFEWKKECFKELSFMITTKKLPLSYSTWNAMSFHVSTYMCYYKYYYILWWANDSSQNPYYYYIYTYILLRKKD